MLQDLPGSLAWTSDGDRPHPPPRTKPAAPASSGPKVLSHAKTSGPKKHIPDGDDLNPDTEALFRSLHEQQASLINSLHEQQKQYVKSLLAAHETTIVEAVNGLAQDLSNLSAEVLRKSSRCRTQRITGQSATMVRTSRRPDGSERFATGLSSARNSIDMGTSGPSSGGRISDRRRLSSQSNISSAQAFDASSISPMNFGIQSAPCGPRVFGNRLSTDVLPIQDTPSRSGSIVSSQSSSLVEPFADCSKSQRHIYRRDGGLRSC